MEMIIYTESYSVIVQEGQEPEQRPELHCGSREKRNRMKKIFVYIIMSSLIAGKDLAWSWMAWDAAALFYTTTDTDRDFVENVWKINLKTRSEERFVSKEQLWRVAAAALGIEESGMELCAVTRLFCDGGRCYVQVQVNWPEEEIYHMEYLMFSQGEEETELRFEKALTECMRTYGTTREGKWMNYDKQNKVIVKKWVTKEHVLLRDAKCY